MEENEVTIEQIVQELLDLHEGSKFSIEIENSVTGEKKVKCYITRGENPPRYVQVPCSSYHEGETTIE